MTRILQLAAVPLLALAASASADTRRADDTRPCVKVTLPVIINATTSTFDIPRVDNTIDAVDFAWEIDHRGSRAPPQRITGQKVIDDEFFIDAKLCIPKDGAKRDILQIATHGFGFDSRYWDSQIDPEKYSYVDAALKKGYSILTYDRLGTGHSDRPDAYDVVQIPTEIEVLSEIATLARDGLGEDMGDAKAALDIPTFDKIVLVGHSLGSSVTLGVLEKYPDLADGAVSTGLFPSDIFTAAGQRSFGLEYAAENDPEEFKNCGSGYMVPGIRAAIQQLFFKKGHFDKKMLEYAESIKQTGTVGEFLTLTAPFGVPAPEYKGPLLFALGELDFAVCMGNCTGAYDLDGLKKDVYPNAKDLRAHVQPGSGHALTMHDDAQGHFKAIFDYLDEFEL
ncbi:Alpha/Beta hydrolase protein [Aspergillus venezuelensis]